MDLHSAWRDVVRLGFDIVLFGGWRERRAVVVVEEDRGSRTDGSRNDARTFGLSHSLSAGMGKSDCQPRRCRSRDPVQHTASSPNEACFRVTEIY